MTLFALSFGSVAIADDDFVEEAPVEGTLTSPEDAFGDANSQLGKLPSIEAKIYNVQIVRPSKSGRVYLIQKNDSDLPEIGRIFLLKDSATPAMAFRVLKTYPENQQIAAKRVRVYPGFDELAVDAQFRAYEKKGNIAITPPPSSEDQADLMDLEQSPAPAELQSEPTAATEVTENKENDEFETEVRGDPGEQDVEVHDDTSVDEDYASYDYFPNWLTVPFGMYLGNSQLPGSSTQKGTGLLYGRNMGSRSFTLEGGFFYYKAAGDVAGVSKSYTLMPLVGMGRFNFPVTENVLFFLYGGVQYKWVIGNLGATPRELQRIAVAAPLAGLGVFVQVGPNWFLKFNLGIDSVLGGIALRF
jgi:hypothetical protein